MKVTRIRAVMVVVLGSLLLAGCPRGPKHTLEEYKANRELAMQTMRECQLLTPAERSVDKDCALANAALLQTANSGTEMPPLDL